MKPEIKQFGNFEVSRLNKYSHWTLRLESSLESIPCGYFKTLAAAKRHIKELQALFLNKGAK